MCSVFGLRFLFALFPAYVSCLGSYEGNMPATNVQRVPKRTFPEMIPEVKQVGNLIDLPHTQDNHRHYNSYQEESLFVGSSVKSDSKDCQTHTELENQNNVIKRPFASVPNYNLLAFGQPSSQFESNAATDVLQNVQPVSQLAYTFSQGGSTFMETPKVFDSKTFKPSRDEFRYEAPKSSAAGSSKIFVVQAPENAYNHVVFKTPVSRDALVGGPNQVEANSISSQFSNLHGASQKSQSFRKFQAAGSTYGPILMGAHVHSRTNSRKPSRGGFTYAEAKPSVVSSGPIFILQGSESTQALGSTLSKSVKPLGVPSMVDFNQYVTPQSGQTSSVALNVGRQHSKLWNESLYSSMREGQNRVCSKPQKQSGSYRRVNVGKSVSSSGEIRLGALESAEGGKSLPHYESREDVRHPGQFQKTYNTRGPSQTGYLVYSASGSEPNQVKPMHPTQNGVQHNVVKSSIASSGEIRMMSGPANVQSKPQSFKLQVTSKPSASSLENRVKYPSSQTALQYQSFEASQNSNNVQPTTGTFANPHQSGYKIFSSLRGISYKPGSAPSNALSESRFRATNPSIDDSDEINEVRVRLNKWPQSNFGNLQNQWASGNNVGALTANSGASQSVLSSNNLGQRQGQNVQTPLVPLHHGSKKVQSQSAEIQENAHAMFGQGVIRRLSTVSSSYRPASQNQAQRVVSSAPGCEVTQNHLSGVGQQGPFQGVKYTSSSRSSQRLL